MVSDQGISRLSLYPAPADGASAPIFKKPYIIVQGSVEDQLQVVVNTISKL